MERLDHLEHLDRHLVDELAQVARETVREELRGQRRTAVLYAASGAAALYAGAALALAVGLALALGLPDWAAALITGAILAAVAYVLRGAARPSARRPTAGTDDDTAAAGRDRVADGTAAAHAPYPPMPPVAPGAPSPGAAPTQAGNDPEQPHHRG